MKNGLAYFGIISLNMILPIIGGVLLGDYISRKTGKGLFLILFIILGVIGGFYSCYRVIRKV